jgi:predicted dehydrogenase
MAKKLGVGVIGCGNISAAYLRLAPLFRGIEMRACADIDMAAAAARAAEFGVRRRWRGCSTHPTSTSWST